MDADGLVCVRLPPRPQHGRRQLLVVVTAAEPAGHALGDAAGRDVVLADRRQQGVEVDVAVVVDDLASCSDAHIRCDGQALAPQLLGQRLAPGLDHVERAARG